MRSLRSAPASIWLSSGRWSASRRRYTIARSRTARPRSRPSPSAGSTQRPMSDSERIDIRSRIPARSRTWRSVAHPGSRGRPAPAPPARGGRRPRALAGRGGGRAKRRNGHARQAHRLDGQAHVALRLAFVVRLGEPLPRERLVGDLTVGSRRVGVVGERPLGAPAAKRPTRPARRPAELGLEQTVSLGVDHDRAPHPASIWRVAIQAAVTVFPDPSRPRMSVCDPAAPARGDRNGQSACVDPDDAAGRRHPDPGRDVRALLVQLDHASERLKRAWALAGGLGEVGAAEEVLALAARALPAGAQAHEQHHDRDDRRQVPQDEARAREQPRPAPVKSLLAQPPGQDGPARVADDREPQQPAHEPMELRGDEFRDRGRRAPRRCGAS